MSLFLEMRCAELATLMSFFRYIDEFKLFSSVMEFFFGTTWYMAFRPKLHGYELNVEGVNKQASKNRCQVTGNRDGIHHGTRQGSRGMWERGESGEPNGGCLSLRRLGGRRFPGESLIGTR